MASTASLLVLGVLLLALVEAESLAIRHSYPEPGNFSYVELACYSDGESTTGARFQLNGTDIEEEELVVETQDSGAVRIVLTQEKEGFFTCSENESVSSNSIGLAAEPRINTSTDPLEHRVGLPDSGSTVPIVLECGITLGKLLQRYSVQWIQVSSNIIPLNISSTSNLTLNVTRSTNGLQYQCQMTVDHDGNSFVTYYGNNITITVQVDPPPPKPTLSIVVGVVVGCFVLVCAVMIVLVQWTFYLHRRPMRSQYFLEPLRDSLINQSSSFDETSTIDCDDNTLTFYKDPQNMFIDEDNDFKLEIPEGAVPDGEATQTISLGVALFGPFQFPEGLRPVSPVFRVCVSDKPDFRFSKPVTITIPHFLDLETNDDIQNLGLTFLKAGHNKNSEGLYEFRKADGQSTFEPLNRSGVLQTTHFCSLCIASRDIPECLEKAKFCITAVLPNPTIPARGKTYGYFFITFQNLKTCLRRLDDIINAMDLVGYEVERDAFQFQTIDSDQDPALKIVVTQPTNGRIGLTGNTIVSREEVDFSEVTETDMLAMEDASFYPPHLRVFFTSSLGSAPLSDGRIEFSGATKPLVYDISLDVSATSPPVTDHKDPSAIGSVFKRRTLDINDLFEVESKITDAAGRWRHIGLALGIKDPLLEVIDVKFKSEVEECLAAMLRVWLRQSYDTERHGKPSWERLSAAISHRCGGNDSSLGVAILEFDIIV